jgi:hypothetical protein
MSKEEEKKLESAVMTRLLRLNATINGVVSGLAVGFLIFIATIWLVIKGGPVVGPNLSLLGQFFIGYSVTLIGSVIGFGYGFLTGFLFGYIVSAIYNWILDIIEKK